MLIFYVFSDHRSQLAVEVNERFILPRIGELVSIDSKVCRVSSIWHKVGHRAIGLKNNTNEAWIKYIEIYMKDELKKKNKRKKNKKKHGKD